MAGDLVIVCRVMNVLSQRVCFGTRNDAHFCFFRSAVLMGQKIRQHAGRKLKKIWPDQSFTTSSCRCDAYRKSNDTHYAL
eukprot:scaffold1890_cov96-Cylindrotheca_fusiformis.AAC.4